MARQDALNILVEAGTKAKLAEAYGNVIDNIEKTTISSLLKNTNLSGDPTTGTVEAERVQNTDSQAYGTARSGKKAQAIKADPVVIAINTDKELINEVEEKDLSMFGVDGLIAKKTAQNEKSMKRELERAFFNEAGTAGVQASLVGVTIEAQVEELIQAIETTKNDYVDGVERDMISVILTPAEYGKLRDHLDTTQNANINTAVGEVGMYHGVRVFSSVYLPVGKKAIAMVDGAVAQPVRVSLDDPAKIDLSDAYHFGMFYYYGTKAVMPDLIQVVSEA